MPADDRDLIQVLKFELQFLEKGGYGRSPREPWRPSLIFEDSPTCMNYDARENPGPCGDCVLMQLVPENKRNETIPCRHIPLNPAGETIESFYRWGTEADLQDAMAKWLRATLSRLEQERARREDRQTQAAATASALSEPR